MSIGARELELKAVVGDAAALAARLAGAGTTCTFRGVMRDRRYDLPDRSLMARDEVLRVRTFEPAGLGTARAELTWKGPTQRTDGYKEREELQFDVGDAAAAGEVIARLGFEVSDAIDRCVAYHEVAGAVVRIEWYPRMDVLVEVEGAPEKIERAVAATGLARTDFTADRLLDFAARYEQRTGTAAVLRLDMLGPNEAPGFPEWAAHK
ncbi:MAG: CYTH domain-containing protein [Gemmatimonadales bacterium]